MEWIVLVAFAVLCAGKKATSSAVGSFRKNYRSRVEARRQLVRDAVAQGIAVKSSERGMKAGAAVGVTITGWGLAGRAFLDNWRTGWNEGRERARARLDKADTVVPIDDTRKYPSYTCLWVNQNENRCGDPVEPGTDYCPKHYEMDRKESAPVAEDVEISRIIEARCAYRIEYHRSNGVF